MQALPFVIPLVWLCGARGHSAQHCRAVCRGLFTVLVGATAALCCIAPAHAGEGGTKATPRDDAALCDRAAAHAARVTGVPGSVLRAIALTETGRKRGGALRPWPWTVNMEGAGHWFDSRAAALSYAQAHLDQGARSFDLGCFQINYRWHGKAFASLDSMFDPTTGALYAARMLQDLYAELGDWRLAAGAYHSRTPKYANRYAARFARIHTRLALAGPAPAASPVPPPPPPTVPRRTLRRTEKDAGGANGYPLLMAGGQGRMGSLVPLDGTIAQPLFGALAAPQG